MTVKALVGYGIASGVTPDEYDRWLWEIHVPDLMQNPYLDRLVFNTVREPVSTTSGGVAGVAQEVELYRIAELHFADEPAFRAYRRWFEAHPIPENRGPKGRSAFRFYVFCEVDEVVR